MTWHALLEERAQHAKFPRTTVDLKSDFTLYSSQGSCWLVPGYAPYTATPSSISQLRMFCSLEGSLAPCALYYLGYRAHQSYSRRDEAPNECLHDRPLGSLAIDQLHRWWDARVFARRGDFSGSNSCFRDGNQWWTDISAAMNLNEAPPTTTWP